MPSYDPYSVLLCFVLFSNENHSFISTLGLAGLQQRACSSSGLGWIGSELSVSGCSEKDTAVFFYSWWRIGVQRADTFVPSQGVRALCVFPVFCV